VDQSTVIQALARIGTGRRFFAPEHAGLLQACRQVFLQAFGIISPVPWFDLVAMQSPVDYLAYAECIVQKRPRVVVETGTASGACALFYLEALRRVHGDDNVRVITIEVERSQIGKTLNAYPQIVSIVGSSVDPEVVSKVYRLAAEISGPVMVTLDSDHSAEHVAKELGSYADLVSPGQYLIVQDTYLGLYWGGNLNGEQQKAVLEGRGGDLKFDYIGCPLGSVEAFLSCDSRFSVDLHPQRWVITQCPFGFLLKSKG